MDLYSTLSGIFTVVTFVTFVGIVHWALAARRRDAFAEAAKAPFALPDEPVGGDAEGHGVRPMSMMVAKRANKRRGAYRRGK